MKSSYAVIPASSRPRPLDVLGTKVTVLTSAEETNSPGVTFQEGEEGSGPPPHSHDWDESFYVLSGEVIFRCGDDTHVCTPGTLVRVPRNTVHGFSYGAGGGSMLELTSSDGHAAELFTEVDARIDAAAPDIPQTLAILESNGVTIAG
ncbi:MAG: cupin domain-containing protein [Gammaproteobacteria bacterium]